MFTIPFTERLNLILFSVNSFLPILAPFLLVNDLIIPYPLVSYLLSKLFFLFTLFIYKGFYGFHAYLVEENEATEVQ